MKNDAIAFGIAGILFGLIAGWIIGSQQAVQTPRAIAPAVAQQAAPADVNVSTDLGVCYYYINRPDEALAQFAVSLKLDPKHPKTLLNMGIVKAFGKQDLQGASEAWQDVIKVAPGSPQAQAAKRALDSLQSAHPAAMGGSQKPGV